MGERVTLYEKVPSDCGYAGCCVGESLEPVHGRWVPYCVKHQSTSCAWCGPPDDHCPDHHHYQNYGQRADCDLSGRAFVEVADE